MSLNFTLQVKAVPVTLTGADGKEISYELREMSASVRDKYLDQLGERMKLDAEGKVAGVKKFDGLQTALLASCLYNAEGQLVKKEEIQSWPSGTVSALFNEAQQINMLSATKEEVAEGAKKD
jgi:hypothetical protein